VRALCKTTSAICPSPVPTWARSHGGISTGFAAVTLCAAGSFAAGAVVSAKHGPATNAANASARPVRTLRVIANPQALTP
jgi:hypothetical protein